MHATFIAVPVRMSQSLHREKAFALDVTRRATQICLKATRQARCKRDDTPVTAADLAIQAIVVSALQLTFDNDVLLGEEDISDEIYDDSQLWYDVDQLAGFDARAVLNSSNDGGLQTNRRAWTLDPIDGTKGFLSGHEYAVGLALLDENANSGTLRKSNTPPLGALALPAEGVIFLANASAKSLEEHTIENKVLRKLDVPNHCKSVWMLSGTQNLSLPGLPPWTPLCCGSLVKYAAVARKRAMALVQALPTGRGYIWDHAAGITAVVAAGGRVTDEFGQPARLAEGPKRRNVCLAQGSNFIVATTLGVHHDEFIALVRNAVR